MVSRITIAVFLTLSLHALAQVDLTPLSHVSELEGIKEEITGFRNGTGVVTWHSPHGWRISGGGVLATLSPADFSQAEASVEIVGPPTSDVFDENFVRKLKTGLQSSLPREVTGIEWAEDEHIPLSINGHPTFKATYSYTLAAQRFTATVWVCNFAKQQIHFRLRARTVEFSKLQEIFRQSLYTWQGLE